MCGRNGRQSRKIYAQLGFHMELQRECKTGHFFFSGTVKDINQFSDPVILRDSTKPNHRNSKLNMS